MTSFFALSHGCITLTDRIAKVIDALHQQFTEELLLCVWQNSQVNITWKRSICSAHIFLCFIPQWQ